MGRAARMAASHLHLPPPNLRKARGEGTQTPNGLSTYSPNLETVQKKKSTNKRGRSKIFSGMNESTFRQLAKRKDIKD